MIEGLNNEIFDILGLTQVERDEVYWDGQSTDW